jgi:hypothetical protein
MNSELQNIDNYLKNEGFKEFPFSVLSKPDEGSEEDIPLVTDENTAYWFDKISDSYYTKNLHSADALLLKSKRLYLIEFKHVKPMIDDEKEKEILRLKLFLKMVESFHTLRDCVFIGSDADPSKFERWFILVTEHSEEPLATTANARRRLSGNSVNYIAAGDVYKDSFGKYRQQHKKSSRKVYYDSVEIWADVAFSDKIKKLK